MKISDLSIFNTDEARLRTLSAVILAPVFLGVVWLGGASYALLVALICATALFEWLRLVDPDAPKPECYGLIAALVLSIILAAVGLAIFGIIVIAMAGVVFYTQRSNENANRAFWFAIGLPYLAGSGIALVYLRNVPQMGGSLTLYLLACVWGMDIGAYFTGRLFGGPKLMPSISPSKTWSGYVGGLVLASVLAMLILCFSGASSLFTGFIVALLLATVAQAGDFFKSFFKRRAGVKDCGNLIPGHGGVLDRIDGLVFAALFLAFLQVIFGAQLIW